MFLLTSAVSEDLVPGVVLVNGSMVVLNRTFSDAVLDPDDPAYVELTSRFQYAVSGIHALFC